MDDALRLLAGDCTITYHGTDTITQRGAVLILVKPDDTVLVHDTTGYQPVAWLTRADAVRVRRHDTGFELFAAKDDATLRVESHTTTGDRYYPISPAGNPIGDCPDCAATLIHTGGTIVCTGCATRYSVPRDATIRDDTCPTCDLPRMRVERGAVFDLCIDYSCEALADIVADQFDETWPCPDCLTPMTISQSRGLRADCPDCDTSIAVPRGTITGDCPCGLPLFASAETTRCFDPSCDAGREAAP